MTSFYIKTDLDVAGPFTGIEIREASLAGILRPNTFLAGTPNGPWLAAQDAGLFSETGVALPHPTGTDVPLFQTRGMPGAFMGPFKLRELIGFACQGMLPPGAELQSDPSRPWIPITGTGILPACLRGELVRIQEDGRLCLRTVIPADLDLRKQQLETLKSPIERAQQLSASGATTKPLERHVGLKSDPPGVAHQTERPAVAPPVSQPVGQADGSRQMDVREGITSQPAKKQRRSILAKPIGAAFSSFGRLVSNPKIALAAVVLIVGSIGLPVAYSSWSRAPLPRQEVLGNWVSVTDQAIETATPNLGVRLGVDGTCVLINASGKSWTGDFKWSNRIDEQSGFNPSNQIDIKYDTAAPNHQEAVVEPSDGYLRLSGFVKDPPRLDGHPVRDLFVRRMGDQLWLGYPTVARWDQGQRQLTAAWVVFDEAVQPSRSITDLLRELPEESDAATADRDQTQSLCHAIDAATKGREYEYKGKKQFRNGCFVHSQIVDAAYLLKHAGVPDEARPLRPFETQPSYSGPSVEDAQLLRYGDVKFHVSPEGDVLFLELTTDSPSVA